MNIKKRYTLKAHERLKSRKAINELFHKGKSISLFPFKVIYTITTNEQKEAVAIGSSLLHAAFSVSTKHFKKAVDRNRIKRLMRETYRLQKNDLMGKLSDENKKLSVFFIYTASEIFEYQFFHKKMGILLNRLIKLVDEESIKGN